METRNTKRPIVAIDISDRRVYKFDSIKEACDVLNVRHSEIYRILKGQRKSTGGFVFEDLEEYLERRRRKNETPPLR